jgi:hypothetical protein
MLVVLRMTSTGKAGEVVDHSRWNVALPTSFAAARNMVFQARSFMATSCSGLAIHSRLLVHQMEIASLFADATHNHAGNEF